MDRKWRKGYKVVQWKSKSDRYVSFRGFDVYFCTIYKIGHITRRPQGCGPLAVFSAIKEARKFLCDHWWLHPQADMRIVRCRYIASQDDAYWIKPTSSTLDNKPDKFYPSISGKRFADEVELIEEVK